MFSPRSNPSCWRLTIERAADTVVAFATLESITSVRELLGLDAPPAPRHPHQRPPLQPRLRPGRPGVVGTRPQVCTTAPASRPRTRTGQRALH
ncbi:MAG: hypothetical protein ACXVFK_14625 [Solirubrobacteraceae bacterium]